MRIGMFATWLSETRGGIENLTFNLFTSLQKRGHDIKALSLNVDEKDKFEKDVFYAKTSKRTVPLWFYFQSYRRERKRQDFDVNIAGHWATGLVAYAIKKVYKTPYVVYLYGKEVDYFPTPLHKFLVKLVLNNAATIISISNYTTGLCNWIDNKNIALIPPGVDSIMFKHPAIEQPKKNGIELFGISRLVRRKGFQYVIKAVKLLVEEGYDVHFRLAGGGEMEQELRELVADLQLENNVTFLGRVSQEDKLRYTHCCDLFVMASHEIKEEREIEGFGIVYLEANAAGKFVIAGNSGGIPDAVQDGVTGYLIDGKNPEEIKTKILEYVNKPEAEKLALSAQCVEWAEAHHWDKIAQRVEKELLEVSS